MQIYYLPFSFINWDNTDSQLLKCVSQKRREKILSYTFVQDQKLSLYAALVTRMGLSEMSKIPASKLLFQNIDNHKPLLLTAPDFHFNFSHTKDAILCCISSEEEVGADIEKLVAAPLEVMEHVFHSQEIQYVQSSPVSQQDSCFFEIWTRKEAYLKKLGIGLVQNPAAYNTLAPAISIDLHTWQQDNYICSVCGKNINSMKLNRLSEEDVKRYFKTP